MDHDQGRTPGSLPQHRAHGRGVAEQPLGCIGRNATRYRDWLRDEAPSSLTDGILSLGTMRMSDGSNRRRFPTRVRVHVPLEQIYRSPA